MKKLSDIAENIVLISNMNIGENYAYFEIHGIGHREFIYFDENLQTRV